MEKKKNGVLGGIGVGFLMFIGGICLLWWNEGRTVKTEATIKEVESDGIEVKEAVYKSENNDKIVVVSGNTHYETVTDDVFNITVDGLVLERNVEIYEWEESCSDDNCTYRKVWSNSLIDSSSFSNKTYTNPQTMLYQEAKFYTSNAKLGDFNLSTELLSELETNDTLAPKDEVNIEGFHIYGSYYTNAKDINNPEIGDLRITYTYSDANEVTALGLQKEKNLSTFTGKSGYSVSFVREGIFSIGEVVTSLRNSNKMTKWLLRGAGALLIIIGIASVLSPITNLIGKVPLLGNIVNGAIGFVAFGIGLAISLVVIAVAWFRYRPILSICLIVAVIALIILVKKYTANKKEKSA